MQTLIGLCILPLLFMCWLPYPLFVSQSENLRTSPIRYFLGRVVATLFLFMVCITVITALIVHYRPDERNENKSAQVNEPISQSEVVVRLESRESVVEESKDDSHPPPSEDVNQSHVDQTATQTPDEVKGTEPDLTSDPVKPPRECDHASGYVAKATCEDDVLKGLNDKLLVTYQSALERSQSRKELEESQAAWLAEVEAKCTTYLCIGNALGERDSYLQAH